MKDILITGGFGFIGQNLTKELITQGYRITILDDLSSGVRFKLPLPHRYMKLDISNKNNFKKIPNKKYFVVFHLAAQSSGPMSGIDSYNDFKRNVLATFNILDWSSKKKVKKFIFTSSMSVYGSYKTSVSEKFKKNPESFYGMSKNIGEEYVNFFKKKGLKIIIFRLFSVYGPGQNLSNKMQGMLSIYLSYIIEDKPIIVKGNLNRIRDFVFIDDVIKILIYSLSKKSFENKTFNLGTGKKTSVIKLINLIKNKTNKNKLKIVNAKPTIDDSYGVIANNKKLINVLNKFKFTNLSDGINKFLENLDE